MKRSQLEHLIRAAADITGEREFVIIGSQAVLGQFPNAPDPLAERIRTIRIDPPEKREYIEALVHRQQRLHDTGKRPRPIAPSRTAADVAARRTRTPSATAPTRTPTKPGRGRTD